MIIDELVLNNFGPYRGRQSFELTPPSDDKPITLIGGMNGGGKTTFLDAVQLVLYGKRADCSNRDNQAYLDFLADCIHRNAPQSEGAAVEMSFRHHSDGSEQKYRVRRSWYPTEKSISESVEVSKNGKIDDVVTENWDEYVEEFIPLGISQLFLFDGEKIARFADIQNSAELLQSAVQTLLGLDIVDQLSTDLVALRRRKQTALKTEEQQEEIKSGKEKVAEIEDRLDEVTQKRGAVKKDLDRKKEELRKIEEQFRVEGGDLFEQRKELEARRNELERKLDSVKERLREIAAGPAPLLLVSDLLKSASEQDELEQSAMEAEILAENLSNRDESLLETFESEIGLEDGKLSEIRTLLEKDREERVEGHDVETYLELHPEGRHQLEAVLQQGLPNASKAIDKGLDEAERVAEKLLQAERKLAAVPDEEAITNLIREREQAQVDIERLKSRLKAYDDELEELQNKHEEVRNRVVRMIESQVDRDFQVEASSRVINHSEKVEETLDDFRTKVIREHIDRIEDLVLHSFQTLLRKENLVERVEIDPNTFELTLFDDDAATLPPQRLSAGERQLLAVALLWGLGRASGRPMPTMVDTPLGRLDSSHRMHLVKRYFPNASHQVVLLSTDEEIEAEYYEELEPFIGNEYLLDHDKSSNETVVKEGYFEEVSRDVA